VDLIEQDSYCQDRGRLLSSSLIAAPWINPRDLNAQESLSVLEVMMFKCRI
jgi:hypothetical protein